MTDSPPNRQDATASIAVSVWDPQPYDEPGAGPTLIRIHVEESFTGDIAGSGVATMLQALRPDGSASFCALERIDGTLGDRAGSFVLQDTGELAADGHVAGTWIVVPGSATGQLTGLRGEGGFDAQLGQHATATLTYSFEE